MSAINGLTTYQFNSPIEVGDDGRLHIKSLEKVADKAITKGIKIATQDQLRKVEKLTPEQIKNSNVLIIQGTDGVQYFADTKSFLATANAAKKLEMNITPKFLKNIPIETNSRDFSAKCLQHLVASMSQMTSGKVRNEELDKKELKNHSQSMFTKFEALSNPDQQLIKFTRKVEGDCVAWHETHKGETKIYIAKMDAIVAIAGKLKMKEKQILELPVSTLRTRLQGLGAAVADLSFIKGKDGIRVLEGTKGGMKALDQSSKTTVNMAMGFVRDLEKTLLEEKLNEMKKMKTEILRDTLANEKESDLCPQLFYAFAKSIGAESWPKLSRYLRNNAEEKSIDLGEFRDLWGKYGEKQEIQPRIKAREAAPSNKSAVDQLGAKHQADEQLGADLDRWTKIAAFLNFDHSTHLSFSYAGLKCQAQSLHNAETGTWETKITAFHSQWSLKFLQSTDDRQPELALEPKGASVNVAEILSALEGAVHAEQLKKMGTSPAAEKPSVVSQAKLKEMRGMTTDKLWYEVEGKPKALFDFAESIGVKSWDDLSQHLLANAHNKDIREFKKLWGKYGEKQEIQSKIKTMEAAQSNKSASKPAALPIVPPGLGDGSVHVSRKERRRHEQQETGRAASSPHAYSGSSAVVPKAEAAKPAASHAQTASHAKAVSTEALKPATISDAEWKKAIKDIGKFKNYIDGLEDPKLQQTLLLRYVKEMKAKDSKFNMSAFSSQFEADSMEGRIKLAKEWGNSIMLPRASLPALKVSDEAMEKISRGHAGKEPHGKLPPLPARTPNAAGQAVILHGQKLGEGAAALVSLLPKRVVSSLDKGTGHKPVALSLFEGLTIHGQEPKKFEFMGQNFVTQVSPDGNNVEIGVEIPHGLFQHHALASSEMVLGHHLEGEQSSIVKAAVLRETTVGDKPAVSEGNVFVNVISLKRDQENNIIFKSLSIPRDIRSFLSTLSEKHQAEAAKILAAVKQLEAGVHQLAALPAPEPKAHVVRRPKVEAAKIEEVLSEEEIDRMLIEKPFEKSEEADLEKLERQRREIEGLGDSSRNL